MDAGTLHDAHLRVSRRYVTWHPDDRGMVFVLGPQATQAQIDAGNNVSATIPIETKATLASSEFIGRFTNGNIAPRLGAWRQTAGNANSDVLFETRSTSIRQKSTTLNRFCDRSSFRSGTTILRMTDTPAFQLGAFQSNSFNPQQRYADADADSDSIIGRCRHQYKRHARARHVQ